MDHAASGWNAASSSPWIDPAPRDQQHSLPAATTNDAPASGICLPANGRILRAHLGPIFKCYIIVVVLNCFLPFDDLVIVQNELTPVPTVYFINTSSFSASLLFHLDFNLSSCAKSDG